MGRGEKRVMFEERQVPLRPLRRYRKTTTEYELAKC